MKLRFRRVRASTAVAPVQVLAVLAALPLVWVALPADVKGYLPDAIEPYVLAVLALGGLIGRLVDQPKAS